MTGSRGLCRRAAGVLVVAALWLGLPATAAAGTTIPAGFDLFETSPQQTAFQFREPDSQIPQDFFGPGSDPFQGTVYFGGVPLETFGGHMIGDADTVVSRNNEFDPNNPSPVPIELVALSLHSVQPIMVTYNGGQNPEHWQVMAGLSSQPSTGLMNINQESEQGGTFDSFFDVFPVFTFRRSPDGQTKTLDASNIDPTLVEFQAEDVPWRRGCKLPAQAVKGLNDGFCPSFTTAGQKRLTVEQAQLAAHGVYPAQPALEHFKCYALEEEKFKRQEVALADQFGQRKAQAKRRAELCNPVKKNQEPFVNRRAHLQCYEAPGRSVNALVAVQNQLGSQQLLVKEPETLCVPSEKRLVPEKGFKRIRVPIDHYQCYNVEPQSELYRVGKLGKFTLKDQFGTEKKVEIVGPSQLCAPVQKDQVPIQHPVKHLVCYAIKDKEVRRRVEIRNQFERTQLKTVEPTSLCVPSNKLVLQ